MYETQRRKIQVVSIQGNDVIERESSAPTWGALKEEYPEIAMASRGSNAWLKEGKIDLTSDSQPIPNNGEPVVIYLYVDKMKAGYSGHSSDKVDQVMAAIALEEQEEAKEILAVVEEVVEVAAAHMSV